MKVNLKKRDEGGFVNPVREKWDRRIGIAVLTGIVAFFLYLLILVLFADDAHTPEGAAADRPRMNLSKGVGNMRMPGVRAMTAF